MRHRRRSRPVSRLRSKLAVWLAALLAAVVALPLWAPLLGPAHAAVLEAEFTRLSGPSRYSTSVEIAEAYLDAAGGAAGTSPIDTLILGSGLDEHTGWAMPVPLLSRLHRAPLVFIRPHDVPAPVERLIERRQVRRVLLLGGSEVISVSVELELSNLGVEVIERVGGNDVHEHAVAIAESLEHPAGEFADKGRTVLLATSDVFADALAAGPMAYQGEYPILLTPGDRLHPAVFDWLLESDVEHVIIVGGNEAVGALTQQTLAGLDFTVARISGLDRYATAVKAAETLLAGDGLRRCFDGAELGLAYGGLSPDAIAGSLLLGERCAPLLLTGTETLPRSVSLFLRSDTWVTGDAHNRLDLFVLGGTAVVPDELVAEFVERATTLVPMGGRITVNLDSDTDEAEQFTVRFNGEYDVNRIAPAFERGMFSINGERVVPTLKKDCVFPDQDTDDARLYGCVRALRAVVTVQLSRGLKVGDLVSVTGGQRIGLNNSPRPVARFSYVIPAPEVPVDRDAPDVEIVAPSDSNEFAVLVVEANPLKPEVYLGRELASRIRVERTNGTIDTLTIATAVGPSAQPAGTRSKHHRYLLTLAETPAGAVTLQPGDTITVPKGTFADTAGRKNPQRRHTVRGYTDDFRIESVSVGDVEQNAAASVVLSAATQLAVSPPAPPPSGSLTIAARSDGIAAGGLGNGWRIYGTPLRSSGNNDAKDADPEISVSVDLTNRIVRYQILKGEPTFSDLAAALVANRDFAAIFFIADISGVDDGGTIGGTKADGLALTGGGSDVGLRVRFSHPVQSLTDLPPDSSDCKALALLADIAPNFDRDPRSSDICSLGFEAPDALVHMTLRSSSLSSLPSAGNLVFIDGDSASNYGGGGNGRLNVPQGWLSIRYDADVPVGLIPTMNGDAG